MYQIQFLTEQFNVNQIRARHKSGKFSTIIGTCQTPVFLRASLRSDDKSVQLFELYNGSCNYRCCSGLVLQLRFGDYKQCTALQWCAVARRHNQTPILVFQVLRVICNIWTQPTIQVTWSFQIMYQHCSSQHCGYNRILPQSIKFKAF